MTWRGKLLIYGGVLLQIAMAWSYLDRQWVNWDYPWMERPIQGFKFGGLAYDETERSRQMPLNIHAINRYVSMDSDDP